MPDTKADILIKSVESLLVEKQAVQRKEKDLVDGLNRVLERMGYTVVAMKTTPRNGRRRRRRRGRRPGRPPGTGVASMIAEAPKRRGRPPKSETMSRRRGRPPKAAKSPEAPRRRGRPRKVA